MFRIVRFPSAIENFFCSLKTEFRFGHFEYFRMLVLLIAASWEDRNISSLHKYLDKERFSHRTRYNNFMNIARWEGIATNMSNFFKMASFVFMSNSCFYY